MLNTLHFNVLLLLMKNFTYNMYKYEEEYDNCNFNARTIQRKNSNYMDLR